MNYYEERQEEKKDRLLDRAEKAGKRSNDAFNAAKTIGSGIPFGQPILNGHHSEKKHRRALGNIDNNMRKSVEESKKAEYLNYKAEGVGTAGIASDDPTAIIQLKEKLENLESQRDRMKAKNNAWKKFDKKGDKTELLKFYSESGIKVLTSGIENANTWEKQPHPGWELTNLGATIRSTKKRIESLKVLADHVTEEGEETQCKGFSYQDSEGRHVFTFDGKPDIDTRKIIKSYGFIWSPTRTAWVRKITPNSIYSKKRLIEALTEIEIKFN